jgi:hypothetical protein
MANELTREFFDTTSQLEMLFVIAEDDMRRLYHRRNKLSGMYEGDRELLLDAIAEYKRLKQQQPPAPSAGVAHERGSGHVGGEQP